MDLGQMMAVMQQMPTNVPAVPQADNVTVPAEKADGLFAGLLQGMSMQKSVPAAVTGANVLCDLPVAPQGAVAMPGMVNDLLSVLLKNASGKAAPEVSVTPALVKEQSDTSIDSGSQNVMLGLNAAQLALLLGQLQGRTPDVAVTQAEASSEDAANMLQVVQSSGASHDADVSAQTAYYVPIRQAVNTVSTALSAVTVETKIPQAEVKSVVTEAVPKSECPTDRPAKLTVMAATVVRDEPKAGSSVRVEVAAAPQNEVAVTEGDRQVAKKSAERSGSTAAIPRATGENDARQGKVVFAQVSDSLRVVSEPHQRQEPVVMRAAELLTVDSVAPASVSSQPSVAALLEAAGNENREAQPEQPLMQNRVAALSPHTVVSRQSPVQAQNVELPEIPVQPPADTGQPEQLQKVRSAQQPVTAPVVTAIVAADSKADTAAVHQDQREAGKNLQSGQVEAVKDAASLFSGEKQTNSEKSEMSDRGMNGNFLSQGLHQQAKSEGPQVAGLTSGGVQNDVSRAALPAEQVVQQVRDRFVNHETKPGSEQIVLRLSPEHLGELKVNLNLEGQRLKVEIVAENRMVRESLLQHTDALKESLSRQNIKMETFEVTTGGNGTADSSHGQGEWRELAQRRQQNAWMPDGGYRLAKQTVPAVAAYQARSEHTMVDLHY